MNQYILHNCKEVSVVLLFKASAIISAPSHWILLSITMVSFIISEDKNRLVVPLKKHTKMK